MADDPQLWERTRSGDAEAFGDLYERHARAVQSYCLWRSAHPRRWRFGPSPLTGEAGREGL